MLTKDLLISTKRSGRLYPKFIDPKDKNLRDLADQLINLYKRMKGFPYGQVKEKIADIHAETDKVKQGFEKILTDLSELKDDAADIEEFRWEVLKHAQSLREDELDENIRDYLGKIAESYHMTIGDLQTALYSDLPDFRRLNFDESITAPELIGRYNLAQVQGLIIRATKVVVTIGDCTTAIKRALFRSLKFHQLLIDEVEEKGKDLTFTLSGPLSIFSMAQSYGLKFALFIPYLIQLPKFKIEAEIKLTDKHYLLKIDQKTKLQSHYKPLKSYVPQEVEELIKKFNDKYDGYQAEVGSNLLDLGQKSYCFPDISISKKGDKADPIYIELFHRWHFGQLESRLRALEANPPKFALKIGMCRSIDKKAELKRLKSENAYLVENGFDFKAMPPPKQIYDTIVR